MTDCCNGVCINTQCSIDQKVCDLLMMYCAYNPFVRLCHVTTTSAIRQIAALLGSCQT